MLTRKMLSLCTMAVWCAVALYPWKFPKRREKANKEGRTYRPRKDANDAVPSPKAQRNFTDPDSRIMKNADKAFIQGYNAQAAVDAASQVIVAEGLTNSSSDKGQVVPMVEAIQAQTGRRPRELSADNGYCSEGNLAHLAERGIRGYVATGRQKHGRGHRPAAGSTASRKPARRTYLVPPAQKGSLP